MPRDYHFSLYFMYGTQVLSHTSFDRQFATCRPEGQGVLKGWRMEFSGPGGTPNLVADENGRVDGLVWLIEDQEIPKLDNVERGQRQAATCLWHGKQEACFFYTVPPAGGKPDKEFVEKLREAYKVALLPQSQIDSALKAGAAKG